MKCSKELEDCSIVPRARWLTSLPLALSGVAASSSTVSSTVASNNSGPNTVLATIGAHPATLGEVDRKVAFQLYDLRKQALDNIIDEYLVQQAAERAGVKPDEYVDQRVRSHTPQVTPREAEQFYRDHKAWRPPVRPVRTPRCGRAAASAGSGRAETADSKLSVENQTPCCFKPKSGSSVDKYGMPASQSGKCNIGAY